MGLEYDKLRRPMGLKHVRYEWSMGIRYAKYGRNGSRNDGYERHGR